MLDAARFLGGLGFVDVGEVGVVDGACFSGGVKSDEFCQVGGVVDLACFSEGVKFVDFCQVGVVGGVKDLFFGRSGFC